MAKVNKSKGNVPNLRFPEFEGEWESKKLTEILSIGSGRDYKHLSSGDVPVFGTGGLMTYVDECLFEGESVCIGRKGTINKPYYHNGKLWTVDTLFYTHSFKKALPKFIYYIFQNIDWLKYNEASGVPSLSKSTIEKVEVSIPGLDEQEKLKKLLSALDERIQTQNKIIEGLKVQMLGLQEKIFRHKIKMKDCNGNEFPEWKFKNGGELFYSATNKNHNSDLPILAITQDQGAIPRDTIDYQISVTDKSVESYKVVEIGDFIISLRSFQGGIEYSNYKGICSPAYIILKNKCEIEKLFYKYYFKTVDYIKLLNKKLEGIRDGKMISYTYFSEIPLPYPSLEEQTRIATMLICFEKKIELEKRILREYENEKQYLLRSLFI